MSQWSKDRNPLPADWEWRRQRVFERDLFVCQLGYAGVCTGRATEVDHKGHRDDHRIIKLRAVCSECHRVRTQEQSREGVEKRKALLHPRALQHPGLL